jgi:soluble lytic murein transglycosylase
MRIFKSATLWAIFAAILIALPAAASAAGASPQDKAALAARDAFLSGNEGQLARHAEKIRGHALESYVAFWRLSLRLEDAAPDELRDFLSTNAGTALAEQLRRDWLRFLGKNGQWELFRVEHPALVKADPDVACYALQERWQRQDASVSAEIRSFWKAPRTMPEGCAPVVDAMLQSGELTSQDLRDRFRLLVQANLMAEARRVSEHLPADQALSAIQINNAAEEPARFLERSDAELRTAAGRELRIVALTSLARSDLQRAVGCWDGRLRERFPLKDQQYVWAMFATHAARHHLPEAVDWFTKAGEIPLS